jgi:hypothetical protein
VNQHATNTHFGKRRTSESPAVAPQRSHPSQTHLPRVLITRTPDGGADVACDGTTFTLSAAEVDAMPDPWQIARDHASETGLTVFGQLTETDAQTYTHLFTPDDLTAADFTIAAPPEPAMAGPAFLGSSATVPDVESIGGEHRAPRGRTKAGGAPFQVGADGFTPGEQVYVTVVVSTRPACTDGSAWLPVPAALLTRLPGVLIIFGVDSGTLTVVDPRDFTPTTPDGLSRAVAHLSGSAA